MPQHAPSAHPRARARGDPQGIPGEPTAAHSEPHLLLHLLPFALGLAPLGGGRGAGVRGPGVRGQDGRSGRGQRGCRCRLLPLLLLGREHQGTVRGGRALPPRPHQTVALPRGTPPPRPPRTFGSDLCCCVAAGLRGAGAGLQLRAPETRLPPLLSFVKVSLSTRATMRPVVPHTVRSSFGRRA